MKEELTYEEALAQLQVIVKQLENKEVKIDELAATVARANQLVEYCQNKGIKNGCMVCLGVNDKIKNLARKNNVLVTSELGDSYGQVEIPPPTPVSYWHEYVADSFAKIDHLGKAQRKFAQMFRFPLSF